MDQVTADVCVIGGGPSASSLARRLVEFGYAVCLVDCGNAAPSVAESLAPGTASLLNTLGVLEAIQHAGFVRCERTRLCWHEAVDTPRQDRATAIVERRRFDRILLDAACCAGTLLLRPARALTPTRQPDGWIIPITTSTGPITVHAKFLVDARGKRSSQRPYSAHTVALSGRWREADLPAIPEMRVEACRDAWLWGAPLADGTFAAVAFVDTSRCQGLSRDGREALYRTLLQQSRLFKACDSALLLGDIGVRDATPRIDDEPINDSSIKIGDRALSLDPLSSQGLQCAIRSGVQAAAVINTILRGGNMLDAIEFYRSIIRDAARLHGRLARDVYASQSLNDSPFWHVRSGPPSLPQAITSTAVLSGNPRLGLAAEARIMSLPVIQGDMVRRRTALSHPGLDQPVAWLDDIELGPALDIVGAGHSAAHILSEWSRRMLPDSAARLLDWLTRRGILIPL